MDEQFRIHEGRTIHGKMEWNHTTSNGTKSGRNDHIMIRGNYTLKWNDYSKLKVKSYEKFRTLIIEIKSN